MLTVVSPLLGRGKFCVVFLLAFVSSGCAEYRFTFDCASRVNTSLLSEGAPLDIDIVTVTESDLNHNSELARVTAQEWFDYKKEHDGHMMVPAKQVTAVKQLRGSDYQPTVRQVKHRYYDPMSEGVAIYLFADFATKDVPSVLPPHQFEISTDSMENRDYTVVVGTNRIDVKIGEYRGPKKVVKE